MGLRGEGLSANTEVLRCRWDGREREGCGGERMRKDVAVRRWGGGSGDVVCSRRKGFVRSMRAA